MLNHVLRHQVVVWCGVDPCCYNVRVTLGTQKNDGQLLCQTHKEYPETIIILLAKVLSHGLP